MILVEDNHVIVINKPAGLLSQGDRTGDETVVSSVKEYIRDKYQKPGNVYLGLVHRLDRPVSGAMILARTSKAARRLSAAFAQGKAQKHYLALVQGTLEGTARWRDALIQDRRQSRVVGDDHPGAKPASLSWRALGHGGHHTLVLIRLETGRKHQIRCQFAHRGYPLLGDMRYGATREFDGRNLALHSYALEVPHPVKPVPILVKAPLPGTWERWLTEGERDWELRTI